MIRQIVLKKIIPFVLLLILICSAIVGCDRGQTVTYNNQLEAAVKVVTYTVPLDYSEVPSRTWNDPGDLVKAGSSMEFLATNLPYGGRYGNRFKYVTIAVTETEGVVFYRIDTWDELDSTNWTIIITAGSN